MDRTVLKCVALVVAILFIGNASAQSPAPGPGNGKALTTMTQTNGPTIIVDGSGNQVNFKGIGWYGYNLAFAAPEGLADGVNAISQDFQQVVYRQQQMGFNAVRLAFTFDDILGIRSPIVNYTTPCTVPKDAEIKDALMPNATLYDNYEIPVGWEPMEVVPNVTDGICNSDLPNDDTYSRFLWMISYYISQGFYVNLDFHSNGQQDTIAPSNESFADQGAWINNWAILLTDILENPDAQGKLLVDLINEPDGYNLTWQGNGTANSSLTSYYVNAIDALYPICPDCLFLVEGGGQYHWCGINWGNGFLTNQTTIADNPGYNISDATPFLNAIISKPWIDQLVLAPHIYCPGVTDATVCYSGQDLFDGLDQSFGYLTVEPGWCNDGTCRVLPVILDEFGSTLNNTKEMECMTSIEAYVNAIAPASTTSHAPISSWFFWAWQPDSFGTGGMVADDWETIMWNKMGALTGGTTEFQTGFGLIPWYLTSGWNALTSTGGGAVMPPITATAG